MTVPAWKLEAILAVGSDASRRACSALLDDVSRRVSWVYDTSQALKLLNQHSWDIVLLSSCVPFEDATGLARHLADMPQAPPLVVVTSQGDVN